jgi:hypothetical protein
VCVFQRSGSGSSVGCWGGRVAAHATREVGQSRPRARTRTMGSGCALAASDRVGIAIAGSRAGPEECKSQEIVDEMKLGGCICQG